MDNKKLRNDAKIIADLVAGTNTDNRGILLSHIATFLRESNQNFTASILYKAAIEYGLPRNS